MSVPTLRHFHRVSGAWFGAEYCVSTLWNGNRFVQAYLTAYLIFKKLFCTGIVTVAVDHVEFCASTPLSIRRGDFGHIFKRQFGLLPVSFQMIRPHEGEAITVKHETNVDKKYTVARAAK